MDHKFSKSYRSIQRQQSKPRRRPPVVISGGGSAPVRTNTRSSMPFITLPSYRSTIGYYERRKSRWLWPSVSLGALTLLLGLSYLLFLSPLFRLTTINVQGNEQIPQDLIIQTVGEHTNQKKMWFFPTNNLFNLDDEAISQHLASWIDVKSSITKKQFPNTLDVTIAERRSVLAWRLAEQIILIDEEGIVLRIMPTDASVETLTAWPQVFGITPRQIELGQPLLETATAQAMVRLLASARQVTATNIPTIRFQYGDEQNIVLETSEGWQIYVLLADWPNALERLRLLLNQSEAPNRTQLEYIDVRYENRIFTKQKEKPAPPSAAAVVPQPKP